MVDTYTITIYCARLVVHTSYFKGIPVYNKYTSVLLLTFVCRGLYGWYRYVGIR